MGSDELTEWAAFDQLEPFGRTAHQLAILARLKLKPDADITLEDLIPHYMKPPPPPAKELSQAERVNLSQRMSAFFRRKAGR